MKEENNIIHWNIIEYKLKQKYPTLTKADLMWRYSSQEDLLEMIANKLGMPYYEMLKIVDELLSEPEIS
jgi:hypothetical protein